MQKQKLALANLNGAPEIFLTIQGEGVSAGQPAIFIRLSLCNLHCQWCDTPYTWMWNDKYPHNYAKPYNPDEQIVKWDEDQIIQEVVKYPCKRVVITGGEPLLQQKNLKGLFAKLPGYLFEVETNGTIVPSIDTDVYVSQFNVSPKLSNSGNAEDLRDNEEAMRFFAHSRKTWFKFVITSHEDLNEVFALIWKYQLRVDRVILMPEGVTEEALRAKAQWLVDICKEKGFRFSTRLHVFLYGQKRGT